MSEKRRAVLIAGPTASGKSALALEHAIRDDGVIINTDSMQVYDVLNMLSARPQADELTQAEHFLYGVISPKTRYSTGHWVADVETLIQEGALKGRTLIFVGGTGLYFDALINGIAPVPPVAHEIVEAVEKVIQPLDRDGRAQVMLERDPEMARRLNEPDRQRVVRALSVLEATGKSLSYWQDVKPTPVLQDWEIDRIILNPDRDVLRARIALRFELMMKASAVEEVETLLALELDPSLPAMKAIGVPEIGAMLRGDVTREEAVERAIISTHQYAKRQRTWFRNRMQDWDWVES